MGRTPPPLGRVGTPRPPWDEGAQNVQPIPTVIRKSSFLGITPLELASGELIRSQVTERSRSRSPARSMESVPTALWLYSSISGIGKVLLYFAVSPKSPVTSQS